MYSNSAWAVNYIPITYVVKVGMGVWLSYKLMGECGVVAVKLLPKGGHGAEQL